MFESIKKFFAKSRDTGKWSTMRRECHGRRMYVSVNMSAKTLVVPSEYGHRIDLTIPYRKTLIDGFADEAEEKQLLAMVLRIIKIIHRTPQVLGVVNVSTVGRREMYFQAKSRDAANAAVAAVRSEAFTHPFETRIVEDPNWELYASHAAHVMCD